MEPRSDESLFKQLVQRFTDRARGAFSAHYYAAPHEALDTAWTPNDPKSDDAPHVPVKVINRIVNGRSSIGAKATDRGDRRCGSLRRQRGERSCTAWNARCASA